MHERSGFYYDHFVAHPSRLLAVCSYFHLDVCTSATCVQLILSAMLPSPLYESVDRTRDPSGQSGLVGVQVPTMIHWPVIMPRS